MELHTNKKPVVSYYKSGDPTLSYEWVEKLTEINIINTKSLTDEFIDIVINNKDKIFLHIVITGMGQSPFEPNIKSVKSIFTKIAVLINKGFPQNKILVIVNPILSNDNGLKSLELLLRVFTEFKLLRLRTVRFGLLHYKNITDNKKSNFTESYITKPIKEYNKYVISNDNILKRDSTKQMMKYLFKESTFFKNYFKLLKRYETIISIDNSVEALIGVRELITFGINNSWKNADGTMDKIIHYENGNKFKPLVNIISKKIPIRCANRCLLCAWKY